MATINDVYNLDTKSDLAGLKQATDAVEDLDKAQDDLGKNTKKSALSMVDFNAGLEIAQKGGEMLLSFMEHAIGSGIEFANSIDRISTAFGIQAEEASKLKYAVEAVGIEEGEFDAILEGALSKGITLSIDGLADLSKQYNAIEDPIARSQFVTEKFGDAGLALNKVLKLSEDQIRALGDEAKAYGLVMNEEGVKASKELEEQLKKLDAAGKGIELQFSQAVTPGIANFGEGVNWLIGELNGTHTPLQRLTRDLEENAKWMGENSESTQRARQALADYRQAQQNYINSTGIAFIQTTLDQGIVLSDAITTFHDYGEQFGDVQAKIRDVDRAQRDYNLSTDALILSTRELNAETLLRIATEGLSADAALKVAASLGLVDEKTAAQITRERDLKKQYEDGILTLDEYIAKLKGLADEVYGLPEYKAIRVELINSTMTDYAAQHGAPVGVNAGGNNTEVNVTVTPPAGAAPYRAGQEAGRGVADTMRARGVQP